MSAKRKKPVPKRLPNSVYQEYFIAVAKRVRAAGFGTLPRGGMLMPQELDRMDESVERGDPYEQFADWIITRRREQARAEMELETENQGDDSCPPEELRDTIQPSQAA